jgi:hypothetical protein
MISPSPDRAGIKRASDMMEKKNQSDEQADSCSPY